MKLLKLLTVALSVLFFSVSANAGDKLKVGFIYVGPIGDHGWTYRHDIGRQDVEKHLAIKLKPHSLKVYQKVLMPSV